MKSSTPGVWHYAFTSTITLAIVEHQHRGGEWRYAVHLLTGVDQPRMHDHDDSAWVCCKRTRMLACEAIETIMEEARNTTQVD